VTMFTTDKDLRKAVPKKAAVRSTTTAKASDSSILPTVQIGNAAPKETEDIVETAKRERQLRQLNREYTSFALKIQSWWRGRHTARVWIQKENAAFIKGISDIEQLNNMMKARSITFIPPLNSAFNVLKWLLYASRRPKTNKTTFDNLPRFCKFVWTPLIEVDEPAKNILCESERKWSGVPIRALVLNFLSLLFKELFRNSELSSENSKILLKSIETALFPHPEANASIKSAAASLRSLILTENFLVDLREHFVSIPMYKKIIKMTSLEEVYHFFPQISNFNSACDVSGRFKSFLYHKSHQVINANAVFSILFELFTAELTNKNDRKLLSLLVDHILTIPLLFLFIQNDILFNKLILLEKRLDFVVFLVKYLLENEPQHPIKQSSSPLSPHAKHRFIDSLMRDSYDSVLQVAKGYFLLGNLFSIFPRCFDSLEGEMINHNNVKLMEKFRFEFYHLYLDLCRVILIEYPISGILQANVGICWKKTGATYAAIGIPYMLTVLVLHIYEIKTLEKLFSLLFPTFIHSNKQNLVNWEPYATRSEQQEIENALEANSSFSMIKTQFEDTGKSTWLFQPSKWASKLGFGKSSAAASSSPSPNASVNRPKSTSSNSSTWLSYLGLGKEDNTSNSNSSKNQEAKGLLDDSSTIRDKDKAINRLESLTSPELFNKVVNVLLILALNGGNSKMDSLPWKALSFLTFSLPSIPYLWLYLQQECICSTNLTNNISRLMNSYQPERHLFILNNQTDLQQPFNVVFLLTTIFRLYLIAMDDTELYKDSVSCEIFVCCILFLF
jgi:hypothetical protein